MRGPPESGTENVTSGRPKCLWKSLVRPKPLSARRLSGGPKWFLAFGAFFCTATHLLWSIGSLLSGWKLWLWRTVAANQVIGDGEWKVGAQPNLWLQQSAALVTPLAGQAARRAA